MDHANEACASRRFSVESIRFVLIHRLITRWFRESREFSMTLRAETRYLRRGGTSVAAGTAGYLDSRRAGEVNNHLR